MDLLPKALRQKPFTYQEARARGLTQYSLRTLLASGSIERLEHGLYAPTEIDPSDDELYALATKKVGKPVVVCLLSALSHYDLTDVIPKQIWLMVPTEKRVRSPRLKLYRTNNPHWKTGVVANDGYSITSIERTIVDALTHPAIINPRIGIDALKTAISRNQTTASKVYAMAKALKLQHRILPYIEALS